MNIRSRRFRLVTASFAAAALLGAVMASSAVAGTPHTWNSKAGSVETPFTEGQSETVAPELTSPLMYEWKLASTPVRMQIGKITGIGTHILQQGGSALFDGRLRFTELSLKEPFNCTAPSFIETTGLKGEVVAAPALTTGYAMRLVPTTGENFFSYKLGGSCAWAGTVNRGWTTAGLFAEVAPPGQFANQQQWRFSGAINSAAGGNLFNGQSPAALGGSLSLSLTGLLSGSEWGYR